MKKTLVRVLAFALVLCMLPATFLAALANGFGVAKNDTENQSIDNANGQYIPETIVVDGKFDDTGWPIEGWTYVTSANGNWNVETPDEKSSQMMYQYQLRADYKYFYVGAVVVLPEGVIEGDFYVYLSDAWKGNYEVTTAAFKFHMNGEELSVEAIDSKTDDDIDVKISDDHRFSGELVDENKYYIEFRNNIVNTYNDANEIRYFVSANVTTDSGEENGLYHPIYYTNDGAHSVPTSEFWPGGGNELSCMDPDKGRYEGVVKVDGNFDEDIWKNGETTGFSAKTFYGNTGWTSVAPGDGKSGWQNSHKFDDFHYKYKMVVYNNTLYLAVVINTEFKSGNVDTGTNVRFWLRTGTQRYFYDINSVGGQARKFTNTTGSTHAAISNSTNQMKMQAFGDMTVAEFSVPLSEFGGASGFSYYIAVSTVDWDIHNEIEYNVLYNSAYSDAPWGTWDTAKDTDVSIANLQTSGAITVNGGLADDGWNGSACDVFSADDIKANIQYDADYLYGKVTTKFKSGKSNSDIDAIRFWIAGGSKPYAINLLNGTICTDIPLEHECGKADVAKVQIGDEFVYEFKVPLRAIGIDKASDLKYYISAEKGNGATAYTTSSASATSVNVLNTNNTYYDRATSSKTAIGDTVVIDGNLEEEVWNTDFTKASFGNSVVMQQPKFGGSYEYLYNITAGGNYLYGAVVLDDVANSKTKFTLWLDNGIDEYGWIGDNDAKTPHITYTVHTDSEVHSDFNYGGHALKYYTNYKYEFELGGAKGSAVTPSYYFKSDSNLEKDKVKIVKGTNYDYAVTTINGKTYLEFKINVKNFHWLDVSENIEYITSMAHQVNVNGEQEITVYHPEFKDKTNFWLTNANAVSSYRFYGTGTIYSTVADFNRNSPPSKYWYGIKLEPVSGSTTQYKIVELVNGSLGTINGVAATVTKDSFKFTDDDEKKGRLYYLLCIGSVYQSQGLEYSKSDLNQPTVTYADVYWDSAAKKFKNRHIIDLRNHRALSSKTAIFSWKVNDVIEIGYQNEALTKEELLNHTALTDANDLAKMGSIKHATKGWIVPRTALNLSNATQVPITSYVYGDKQGDNSETYSGGTNQYDKNYTILKDGKKATLNMGSSQLFYANNGDIEGKDSTSLIVSLNKAQKTNAYTAYLTSGNWGLDAQGINMEVYGTNVPESAGSTDRNWQRVAGASYNQLYLLKGDGMTLSTEAFGKGTISLKYTGNTEQGGVAGPGVLVDDYVCDDYGDGTKSDKTDDQSVKYMWNQSDSRAFLVKNTEAKKSGADATFEIVIEYPTVRSVDRIDLTYFYLVNQVIGIPGTNVGVEAYNGYEWVDVGFYDQVYDPEKDGSFTSTYPLPQTAAGIYDINSTTGSHKVKDEHHIVRTLDARINLGDTYTAQAFKLQFYFPSYPGGKTYDPNNTTQSSNMYKWEFAGFAEVDFTHTMADYASNINYRGKRDTLKTDAFALTAIAETPVNYQYLKYVFYETSKSEANCIAVDELEVHYSAEFEAMPKQTILHLNTSQLSSGSNMIGATPAQDTYLGRFNTKGDVCNNNGSSMTAPCSEHLEHSNQVFAETVIMPGYNYNANFDVGIYTEFFMERVQTNPVNQPDIPEDNTTNDWDGKNAKILKKLKHIAPDVIAVDGNLNDSGWDGTWTDVDGAINATNLSGDGVKFKYQLRADGEYLYVAAVIDAAESANPALKLWLKGDETSTTFTHLYSVGTGQTTLTIGELPNSFNGVADGAYAVYGNTEVGDTVTVNGNIIAQKNNAKAPSGMSNTTTLTYAQSAIYGYTKEVVESTHDGIWVWEANPITQSYRVALEHARINSAGGKTIGNIAGDASDTIVEFRIALSEFDGADGFEYFIAATADGNETIYPHIFAKDGNTEHQLPDMYWDSTNAVKVTAEDMTGWGIYRMVNDYAPMTSLGAKINDNYNNSNKKAIRFGARYTEEFIRRQANVAGVDYWEINDAGIVFVPTHVIPDKNPDSLDINVNSAKVVTAKDIVNWRNETPDGATNFADYESFVFYVNLVGVPDTAVEMPFAFRGYIDYYDYSKNCNTYYGIPLERSYSLVQQSYNEETYLPGANKPNVSFVLENSSYPYGDSEFAAQLLTDGFVPTYGTIKNDSAHQGGGEDSYAQMFKNNSYKDGALDASVSMEFSYHNPYTVNSISIGVFILPQYSVAPPKDVTLSVKNENGEWVEVKTFTDVYPIGAAVQTAIGKSNEHTAVLTLNLDQACVGNEFKLTFTFPEFEYVSTIHDSSYKTAKYWRMIGLTEVSLG